MGSYSQLTYHIVFGTKFRRKTIRSEIVERFYEYIGGTIRKRKGHLIEVGGIVDHIHLLTNLPSTISVADAVRDIKSNASKWLNEGQSDIRNASDKFEWQIGYGAFTASYSQINAVQRYVQNQQEHHRTKKFEEEYIELLNRHDIKFKREHLFEAEHTG